jgi:hypothetical protein
VRPEAKREHGALLAPEATERAREVGVDAEIVAVGPWPCALPGRGVASDRQQRDARPLGIVVERGSLLEGPFEGVLRERLGRRSRAEAVREVSVDVSDVGFIEVDEIVTHARREATL